MTLAYVRSQQSECLMYKCSYNIIYVDSACLWYQPLYSVVVGIILLSNQWFQCTLLFPITSHQFIHQTFQFISPTVYICLCLTKCAWEQEYICLSVSVMSDKSRRFVTIHVYAWLRARVCFCLSVSVFSDQSHCIVTIPVYDADASETNATHETNISSCFHTCIHHNHVIQYFSCSFMCIAFMKTRLGVVCSFTMSNTSPILLCIAF